jgi:hypothetical protein
MASLLGVALVLALPARADEVTFNDLTDTVTATVTVTSSGSHISVGQCGLLSITLNGTSVSVEGCKVTVTGPSNSSSFTAPLVTLIGGDNGNISDAIVVSKDILNNNAADVIFASDLGTPQEPGIGVPCSAFSLTGGCQVTENGSVQTGATIMWSNGQSDDIHFQSDTESTTPEPSTLLLLGGGLVTIAGYLKTRLT